MHINNRMLKKSRKFSRKTAKTRKQRGGFLAQNEKQQGGSWFSGLTNKVKGLFSIDQQPQQQQESVQHESQQTAAQAVARVSVPPTEPIRVQPGWANVPLNATPRKRKNSLNNWNIIGNNNLPNGRPI